MNDLASVDELADHMSGATFSTEQNRDAQVVLDGLVRGLERRLKRRFTEGVVVGERVFADEAGFAYVSRGPVKEITAVNGDAESDWSGYVYRSGLVGLPPQAWSVVSYVGGGVAGLAVEDLADLKLAVLEKASDFMTNRHDDTVSVKELDTREPVQKAREYRWTDEELQPFEALRLRVVL